MKRPLWLAISSCAPRLGDDLKRTPRQLRAARPVANDEVVTAGGQGAWEIYVERAIRFRRGHLAFAHYLAWSARQFYVKLSGGVGFDGRQKPQRIAGVQGRPAGAGWSIQNDRGAHG